MDLKSRSKATPFQMGNVRRRLEYANQPILDEEVAYLEEVDDLVPVVSTSKAPLRQLIDWFSILNFLRLPPCFRERKVRQRKVRQQCKSTVTDILANWIRKKNERPYNADDDFDMQATVYYKDQVFRMTITVFTIIIGLAILIGPLLI